MIAAILRESFDAALPRLAGLHTPQEDRAFVHDVLFEDCAVFAAEQAGALTGFAAVKPGWIEQFYLRPAYQRCGIGSALLRRLKQDQDGLQLWTFQENTGARAFYARHGFEEVEFTDGAATEEKASDVRMVWCA